MEKTKSNSVILCSHFPLPYDGIGSWTTMYNYYLKNDTPVDFILCPQPNTAYTNVRYLKIKNGLPFKIARRLGLKTKYQPYFEAIKKYLKQTQDTIVLHLIDNAGLGYELIQYLLENNLRDRCYIQFSYHGFLPYFGMKKGKEFVNEIDEFIFLTNLSKKQYKSRYPSASFYSSVLHNGINKELFKPLSPEYLTHQDRALRDAANTCIYLWLANDRPKKGLLFILEIWKKFYKNHPDAVLWVVGSEQDIKCAGVRFFGKFPNSELPRFYKNADVYLFPTQCQEGFGLSLVEALACGCYCIASSIGGVPEVLGYGQLGILVEPYDDKTVWYKEMEKAHSLFDSKKYTKKCILPQNTYSLDKWSSELTLIIEQARERAAQLTKVL